MTTSTPERSLTTKLARDAKRDADSRHKWARGAEPKGPHTVRVRPISQRNVARAAPLVPFSRISNQHTSKRVKPPVVVGDDADPRLVFGEPASEGQQHGVPDPFAYSFDAPRGPSHGEDVLGAAVDRAVERFESKVTEDLVRCEYEIVDEDHDQDHGHGHDTGGATDPESAEDDEFELV